MILLLTLRLKVKYRPEKSYRSSYVLNTGEKSSPFPLESIATEKFGAINGQNLSIPNTWKESIFGVR